MEKDYKQTFIIPGIDFQKFPVYAVDCAGRITDFKKIVYPNPKSAKKYTRNKQLRFRSKQASMFDMLINIGYFDGLGEIVREMPIIIENSKRPKGLKKGLFFLCDYYFANIKLAVELDSEYHEGDYNERNDKLRDEYLKTAHGIDVFRIKNLQNEKVQKTRFLELKELLKTYKNIPQNPQPLIFTTDLYKKLDTI